MASLDLAPPTPLAAAQAKPSRFLVLTVLSAVLALLALLWAVGDPRTVDGAPVWAKPFKFAASFAVLFGTVALIETRLSARLREGWQWRIIAWTMGAAFAAEMGWIGHQAALAEPSHFNLSTPFHEFMYTRVMGVGAVLLVACVGVVGWLIRRDRDADLSGGLREGVWLGFLATFVLTVFVAGWLSVVGQHPASPHPADGTTIPLLGWSLATGDLRPAHFLSLHAMQAVPLLGLWLDRRGIATPVLAMRVASLGYAGLTIVVFAPALLGMPLVAWD